MSSRARRFFGCVLPLSFALAGCALVFMMGYAGQVVVDVHSMPDASMVPIIRAQTSILTNNTAFWFEDPYRPNIVTVQSPDGRTYRRLVGLPGETIQMRNNELTANERVVLRIVPSRPFPDFGPVNLGPTEYFVLSEDPNFPDSRSWGPLKRDQIFGIASFFSHATSGGWKPVFTPDPSTRMRRRTRTPTPPPTAQGTVSPP
jgi:signal peptidase I